MTEDAFITELQHKLIVLLEAIQHCCATAQEAAEVIDETGNEPKLLFALGQINGIVEVTLAVLGQRSTMRH